MIRSIYSRVFEALKTKPIKLWAITLFSGLVSGICCSLFGLIAGVGLCIAILFSTALSFIYLRAYRGEEIDKLMIFDCFKDFPTMKRICLGEGWSMLWIFIWSLIPIAGPIIAIIRAYEYHLTPYILVLEPEVSVTEAINVSKERMNGYKGKLFLAHLLYYVVVGFVVLVLAALAGTNIKFISVFFTLLSGIVLIAGSLLSGLVTKLIDAAFYEEICGVCEK